MTPWRFAWGLSLAALAAFGLWALRALLPLRPYAAGIWADHSAAIAVNAALAFAALWAALYWIALRAGLGELGRKLGVAERALQAGPSGAHDRELAAALERDRRGEWDP